MATLQKNFRYQGDSALTPFKQIFLAFDLPRFNFSLDRPIRATKYSRSQIGSYTAQFLHKLSQKNYDCNLQNFGFIGENDSSILAFWHYLIDSQFKFNQIGTRQLDDVSLLSFDAPFSIKDEADNGFANSKIEGIISMALSSDKFNRIVSNPVGNPVPDRLQRLASERIAYAKEQVILINRNVFIDLSDKALLLDGNINTSNVSAIALGLVSLMTEITSSGPKIMTFSVLPEIITTFLEKFGLKPDEIQPVTNLVSQAQFKDKLFDFPITIPEIKMTKIAGTLKINSAVAAELNDFKFYDLAVDYTIETPNGSQPVNLHFDWTTKNDDDVVENTISFSFYPILQNTINSPIIVSVEGFNGANLYHESFAAGNDELSNLKIEVVSLLPVNPEEPNTNPVSTNSTKLTGKVLELTGNCVLKDVTVLIEAKTSDDSPLKVVTTAKTDASGNFSMPYPLGVFVKAQARVSLTPDSPVDIVVFTDESHKAANHTISDDFLFLLIQANCKPKIEEGSGDDCDCHAPKKAARLPDQEQLISSDEFTQDIGGACINLTTPNRTLKEYAYKAIVRTSDPDVANYTLEKVVYTEGDDEKIIFNLKGGQVKIFRKPVDLGNPVLWQDAPDSHANQSLYQAVTVATGHLLHYKAVMKADGYSLGELLYSLPLAPGQKKQIVIFDQTHTLEGSETQSISQRESLAASLVNERTILDKLSGTIQESITGQSKARTGGISAGLGLAGTISGISGVLGVAGGTAGSSSSASQDSSRNVSQAFEETLRNSIAQNAESYREQNASVVTTVREGQQYGVTAEVISNHNHCHSLTMMYFEVLRHYAVYQELSAVEECLFVPLLMTNFTTENIYKWRDILSVNLLPMPSQTYLQPFKKIGMGLEHPLIKAFDANDRIKTDYENVDFPAGAYDEEKINFLKGHITVRMNFPRPKTRYDRIKSWPIVKDTVEDTHHLWALVGGLLAGPLGALAGNIFDTDGSVKIEAKAIVDEYIDIDANYASLPPSNSIRIKKFDANFFENGAIDKSQWDTYAVLLGYGGDTTKMLEYYFKDKLVAEWDAIFYNELAPVIFENIVNTINMQDISTDFTSTVKYTGGNRMIRLNLTGSTNKSRKEFPGTLKISCSDPNVLGIANNITFIIGDIYIQYSTSHYNGVLYSGYAGGDLLDANGVELHIPENSDEKRNPRKEDKFIVKKLIEHLNSNLEYYNRTLWQNFDKNTLFMLLDGFNIQTNDAFGQPAFMRSLASVVKNELVSIVGNSLVFPVAPGYKVDRLLVATVSKPEPADLFEHYKPLTPSPPYRISISTRGVYAEAVQGACNACEKVMNNTSQDWEKFKTDEPTAINPVTVPVPTVTDWRAAFKDFATPIVNIQNAPSLPTPGAGLNGLNELLGKSDIFKDVTGLTENQKNVLATYKSNQENAREFAKMAKEMNMQAHNTQNSDKIQDSIDRAVASEAISKEEGSKLTKEHLQQMVDGGESKRSEQEQAKQSKPTLTDAAVKAVEHGKTVKAVRTDEKGTSESIEVRLASAGQPPNIQCGFPSNSGTVTKQRLANEIVQWAIDENNLWKPEGNFWLENEDLRFPILAQYCASHYLVGGDINTQMYNDIMVELAMSNLTRNSNFNNEAQTIAANVGANQQISRKILRGLQQAGSGANDAFPWSAVFITYCIRSASIQLGIEHDDNNQVSVNRELIHNAWDSPSHGQYGMHAYNRRQSDSMGYQSFRATERPMELGDIIIQDRRLGNNDQSDCYLQGYNFNSVRQYADISGQPDCTHGDIVVEIEENFVTTIGGNLGNSVRRRKFPITNQGFLSIDNANQWNYTQEADNGNLNDPTQVGGSNISSMSTSRIFTILKLIEKCYVLPGTQTNQGIIT